MFLIKYNTTFTLQELSMILKRTIQDVEERVKIIRASVKEQENETRC